MKTQNYSQYKDREFADWAHRNQLLPAEQFLTTKYLSKDLSTLEAGTGGGCILHCLRDSGFKQLHGFDFLPAFITVAKERDVAREIEFIVADASELPYADHAFGQAIYLQQLLCMIEDEAKREMAMKEVSRVLKPGGIALFSFLCHEARVRQKTTGMFLAYLSAFRFLMRRGKSIQLQPWLKHEGKFNPSALLDKPPYVYWYRVREAVELLERHGFEVTEAASEKEANQMQTVNHHALYNGDVTGMLYLVARKREA